MCVNLVSTVHIQLQPSVSTCIYDITSEYFLRAPEPLGGRYFILLCPIWLPLLRSWHTADLLTCGGYMNLNRTHDLPEMIISQEPLQASDSLSSAVYTWPHDIGRSALSLHLLFLRKSTPSCFCNGRVKLIFNKSHVLI